MELEEIYSGPTDVFLLESSFPPLPGYYSSGFFSYAFADAEGKSGKLLSQRPLDAGRILQMMDEED